MADLQKSLFKGSFLLRVSLVVLLLWLSFTARASMVATRIVPVGIILDLNSPLGYMANNSLTLAVEDYYSDRQDTAIKIKLIVRDISQNAVVAAAKAASDLILKDKVRAILGPQNSEQASFIVRLGEKYQVPVIWFPITGPSLLPPPSPSSIYSDQGLNCFQFRAIADTIKALGWQAIIPIYEDTEDGSHLVPCLSNVLKGMGIRMVNVTAIDSDSAYSQINSTLDKLNGMRPHLYLVHMSIDLGTIFISTAKTKGMMDEGYTWILTQELSSYIDPLVTTGTPLKAYMQSALGVRPLDSNKTRWRRLKEINFDYRFNSSLTIYGWWAYHTIEALAIALERLGTDNGLTLRSEILAMNFTGKSGVPFVLSQGQLADQSVLEVYNVVGPAERIIGYWSPEPGLIINHTKGGKTSGQYKLNKDPLWPGDTFENPRKLRIGVPTTNSFPEFVNVVGTRIDGFAIDVFLKVVDGLPPPLNSYEFVRMRKQSRSDTPMTYDDILCRQMKTEDVDAIIGDITIVANRETCVDFTLPYFDSSVTMVVKVNISISKSIFFKPFNWSLWIILGGIFVTSTIIIVVLERNKSNEFRFNPFLVYKIDVAEKIASSAAGWMVILTSFLFILVVEVYTANLTLILTEGKTKVPLFEDVDKIKSSNLSVGYRRGTWLREFLIEQIGFNPSRLKPLKDREEYLEALSRGTKNGGVDAIFDEIPNLHLFLSKYKSCCTMTGLIYKSGGYAFAFSKKSSMASHYSRAILKVTQDVEPYRALMAKHSLPTSFEDLKFEDQSDTELTKLEIAHLGGLFPIIVYVLALFLGLAILNPPVIQWLRDKFSWAFD